MAVERGNLCIASGRHPMRRMPGPLEGAHQRLGDPRVIFDQEQRCHPLTLPALDARI